MNLTLRQLRAFVAVADLASFTDAAKQLHLTQAALSVLVRELEKSLGVRLLDRSTRKVRLSEPGREFYPLVTKVLEELEGAVAGVASLRDKKRGYVRVAAPQMMSCTLMPRVVGAYLKRYPDIEVRLTDTVPEQVVPRVVSGEVEIGIGPDASAIPDVARTPLLADRHLLVCRKDHPLAKKRRVFWKDIVSYPFIAPTRDFAPALNVELSRAGSDFNIKPAYEVSFISTAIAMTNVGLGVTACPSYSAPLVQGYRLETRPLCKPEFVREVFVFAREGTSLSPAADSFVAFLREFLERER